MSGVVLTASAHCQDRTCGWAVDGSPQDVEKATRRHLKEHPFAVSTVSVPETPEPPRRRVP